MTDSTRATITQLACFLAVATLVDAAGIRFGHTSDVARRPDMRRGIEVAIAEANAAGGVNGRAVTLVALDDGGSAAVAAANARQLIADPNGLTAILGTTGDDASIAVAQVTNAANVPLVGPGSGLAALRVPFQPYVINLRPSLKGEMYALVSLAILDVYAIRFGILYRNDTYGREALAGAIESMAALGLAPVATASYPPGYTGDMTAQVNALLAKPGLNSVIAVGDAVPISNFLNAARFHPNAPAAIATQTEMLCYYMTSIDPDGLLATAKQLTPFPDADNLAELYGTLTSAVPAHFLTSANVQRFYRAAAKYAPVGTNITNNMLEGYGVGRFALRVAANAANTTAAGFIDSVWQSALVREDDVAFGVFGPPCDATAPAVSCGCNQGAVVIDVVAVNTTGNWSTEPYFPGLPVSLGDCDVSQKYVADPFVLFAHLFDVSEEDIASRISRGMQSAVYQFNQQRLLPGTVQIFSGDFNDTDSAIASLANIVTHTPETCLIGTVNFDPTTPMPPPLRFGDGAPTVTYGKLAQNITTVPRQPLTTVGAYMTWLSEVESPIADTSLQLMPETSVQLRTLVQSAIAAGAGRIAAACRADLGNCAALLALARTVANDRQVDIVPMTFVTTGSVRLADLERYFGDANGALLWLDASMNVVGDWPALVGWATAPSTSRNLFLPFQVFARAFPAMAPSIFNDRRVHVVRPFPNMLSTGSSFGREFQAASIVATPMTEVSEDGESGSQSGGSGTAAPPPSWGLPTVAASRRRRRAAQRRFHAQSTTATVTLVSDSDAAAYRLDPLVQYGYIAGRVLTQALVQADKKRFFTPSDVASLFYSLTVVSANSLAAGTFSNNSELGAGLPCAPGEPVSLRQCSCNRGSWIAAAGTIAGADEVSVFSALASTVSSCRPLFVPRVWIDPHPLLLAPPYIAIVVIVALILIAAPIFLSLRTYLKNRYALKETKSHGFVMFVGPKNLDILYQKSPESVPGALRAMHHTIRQCADRNRCYPAAKLNEFQLIVAKDADSALQCAADIHQRLRSLDWQAAMVPERGTASNTHQNTTATNSERRHDTISVTSSMRRGSARHSVHSTTTPPKGSPASPQLMHRGSGSHSRNSGASPKLGASGTHSRMESSLDSEALADSLRGDSSHGGSNAGGDAAAGAIRSQQTNKSSSMRDGNSSQNSSVERVRAALKRIGVRIGIHEGPLNVRYDADESAYEYTGSTVDFAANIADQASTDTTLLSQEAREASQHLFDATTMVHRRPNCGRMTGPFFTGETTLYQYFEHGSLAQGFGVVEEENVESAALAVQQLHRMARAAFRGADRGALGKSHRRSVMLDATVVRPRRVLILSIGINGFGDRAAELSEETFSAMYVSIYAILHTVAKKYRGHVHHFTDGNALISFNAHGVSGTMISRAWACARDIGTELADQHQLGISCGAASGKAAVGDLVDNTGAKHHALCGGIAEQAVALRVACAHFPTLFFLTHGAFENELNTSVYYHFVDVVYLPTLLVTGSTAVCRKLIGVIGDRHADAGDDEWLYVLESGNKKDPVAAFNHYFNVCFFGTATSMAAADRTGGMVQAAPVAATTTSATSSPAGTTTATPEVTQLSFLTPNAAFAEVPPPPSIPDRFYLPGLERIQVAASRFACMADYVTVRTLELFGKDTSTAAATAATGVDGQTAVVPAEGAPTSLLDVLSSLITRRSKLEGSMMKATSAVFTNEERANVGVSVKNAAATTVTPKAAAGDRFRAVSPEHSSDEGGPGDDADSTTDPSRRLPQRVDSD